jgi:hypothetical protein
MSRRHEWRVHDLKLPRRRPRHSGRDLSSRGSSPIKACTDAAKQLPIGYRLVQYREARAASRHDVVVAGHQNDRQVRELGSRLLRQIEAGHAFRHHNIGKQQVNARVRAKFIERLAPAIRRLHREPHRRKHLRCHGCDFRIVLHEQDTFASLLSGCGSRVMIGGDNFLVLAWQVNRHGRA